MVGLQKTRRHCATL
uniref:Uncharacterized protein n=1 Tax=Anguilla anguilla TaxID=7936 RepID=A0A0E9QYW7_ANGAN